MPSASKVFAKLIKNIEVAARTGGPDTAGNPTLYDAIQKARKTSVPVDNIERAVKRGGGTDGGGADYITIIYEAYGPGGTALLIECLTDNRNRSASDVRVAVTRNGGTMADVGSVSRIFDRKGVVEVAKVQGTRTLEEDDLLEATLDADPEDVLDDGENFRVISDPNAVVDVRKAVQAAGLDYESAEVQFVPAVHRGDRRRRDGREAVQAAGRHRGLRRRAERLQQRGRARRDRRAARLIAH